MVAEKAVGRPERKNHSSGRLCAAGCRATLQVVAAGGPGGANRCGDTEPRGRGVLPDYTATALRSLGRNVPDGGCGPPGATQPGEAAGLIPPELPGGRPLRGDPRPACGVRIRSTEHEGSRQRLNERADGLTDLVVVTHEDVATPLDRLELRTWDTGRRLGGEPVRGEMIVPRIDDQRWHGELSSGKRSAARFETNPSNTAPSRLGLNGKSSFRMAAIVTSSSADSR